MYLTNAYSVVKEQRVGLRLLPSIADFFGDCCVKFSYPLNSLLQLSKAKTELLFFQNIAQTFWAIFVQFFQQHFQ